MKRTVKNRAGSYRKINAGKQTEYRAFVPAALPPAPELQMDDEMIGLLLDATSGVRALNEIADLIPDMNQFISMFVRQEAMRSSQIEGTQATLEDILDPALETNANADVEEVVNYTRALNYGINRLETLPLSSRLLREVHRELMTGVRGQHKSPGRFRRSQNWLGGAGSTIETARYIPPCVEDMKKAMSDLEKYMNDRRAGYPLIAAGLIHYQFETIHPFLDGNGRLGRMIIVLYLMDTEMLKAPVIYPSYYLKQNQTEYYDRLALVREKGDYEQWIKFFLRCVSESAGDSLAKIRQLNEMCSRDRQKAKEAGKGSGRLHEYLCSHPIIDVGITAKDLGISYNTAQAHIRKLQQVGILRLADEGRRPKRNRRFVYSEYLEILSR